MAYGISQLARSDFEMRKAYIYKENYLKMLQDYEYSPYFEKIRDKIKSYSNPEDFYKILQNSRIAEFLEDIQFMYSTSEVNKYLRELALSLGVEIDENEEEYDEEGEE